MKIVAQQSGVTSNDKMWDNYHVEDGSGDYVVTVGELRRPFCLIDQSHTCVHAALVLKEAPWRSALPR